MVLAFVLRGAALWSSAPEPLRRPALPEGARALEGGAAAVPGLEGVLRCAHYRPRWHAYVHVGAAAVVGVPAPEAHDSIAASLAEGPRLLVQTDRCADGKAVEAWTRRFPSAVRVVHRIDAGRGPFRRPSDRLLSVTADTKLDYRVQDAGRVTERRRDDGPWEVAPGLRALLAAGPTLGSCVLHDSERRILFTGRLCGYDPDLGEASAFPLEGDHSIKAHASSLRRLADDADLRDIRWILPARGEPIQLDGTNAARETLLQAAARADDLVAKGAT